VIPGVAQKLLLTLVLAGLVRQNAARDHGITQANQFTGARLRISCSVARRIAQCAPPRSLGKTHLGRSQGGLVSVHGVLQVHSAPPALCPHIEWAVAGIVGVPVNLSWVDQPAAPGAVRGELVWQARPGTAAAIVSALAGWNRLRFEVTEEASPGCDAVRYSYTPALGTFSAVTSASGDIMVPENRLLAAMTVAAGVRSGAAPASATTLEDELDRLLGRPWDAELEPFRCAAEGAPVRWLHATG
jgi:Protein of unknown function (DUF3145)